MNNKTKPTYTVKYIGNVEGNLGIGTKKIFPNNKFVRNVITPNIVYTSPTTIRNSSNFIDSLFSKNLDDIDTKLRPKNAQRNSNESISEESKNSFKTFIKTKFRESPKNSRYEPIMSNSEYFQVLHFKKTVGEETSIKTERIKSQLKK